jgi:hypothetical protein
VLSWCFNDGLAEWTGLACLHGGCRLSGVLVGQTGCGGFCSPFDPLALYLEKDTSGSFVTV